ncbi:MAG: hypothetical protein LDL56_03545 [Armatimonadetes bacterium]|jgi:hypothetical protein|nr:hypothetical protein [Armatimonadota bacterium]MCA1996284.1 hypothetical protein [Armatimonadota bacterium]
MRGLKEAFAAIVVALLALGYAASQRAYFAGSPEEWAARVDVPQIKLLALAVVIALLALGLVRDREGQP